MNKQPTIVITGGHVTPAVATIEALRENYATYKLFYIGRQTALEGTAIPSEERTIIRQLGVPFFPLVTGRLQRFITPMTFWSLMKIPIGFFQALVYLVRIRPTVVVSFGGYIALPVVIWAAILRIPIITHEQTRTAGLTNRIISIFARKIAVSFSDMLYAFAPKKTVYTGLPIRRVVFDPPGQCSISLQKHLPILLIAGGSTGAQSLNRLVYPIVPQLTERFMVVHQVGAGSIADATHVRSTLVPEKKLRYQPVRYLMAADYAWLLHHAKIVLVRAGANTVGELAAVGKVALLVPLPWAADNEQYKNAQFLANGGGAVVAEQKRLRPETLLGKLEHVLQNYDAFDRNAHTMSRHVAHDGAARFVREIVSIATDRTTG